MAAIVDRLKEKIKAQGRSAAGVQTISQAVYALHDKTGNGDIAKAIKETEDDLSVLPDSGGGVS